MKKKTINKVLKFLFNSKNQSKKVQTNQVHKKIDLDKEIIQNRIKQLNESAEIINTTTNPQTFFSRFNFALDCLLDLMHYDDSFFKGGTPKSDYEGMLNTMESAVNNMIDRTYQKEYESAMLLKTEKARQNRMNKYFEKMEEAFKNSNTFWQGSTMLSSEEHLPHYDGPLYTQKNLEKLSTLKQNLKLK